MTNEVPNIIVLDNVRITPTPLQLEADRLAWEKSRRRTQAIANIAAGFICSLALCGLLLLAHGLGWLP